LTEGQLRLPHWKESKNTPYITPIPYRSFKKSEFRPLKQNLIYDIRIALEPISVKLPANCKIRIAIGGADVENFKRYPESQKPSSVWNIYHNSDYSSFIQLPFKEIPSNE
jgi:predicted acyl esterase